MVQTIEEFQSIQYHIKSEKRCFYNIKNDRMIVSSYPLEEYFEEINKPSNPLYDFYKSPYKRGSITNFQIVRIILNSNNITMFHKISLFLTNKYISFTMLFLSILYFPQVGTTIQEFKKPFNLNQLPIKEVLLLYLIVIIVILPLHEYAHFSVYYKYFKPPKVTFGFSIRYFSMPVFFIKVPFYKLMSVQEKNELILAGIKFQVAIWFLLSIIHYIEPSKFICSLLLINIGLIITNLLPFLKLDGYWYLSNVLKVDDYMNYFKQMISKKVPLRADIFILGVFNFIFIIISIVGIFHDIITFIN